MVAESQSSNTAIAQEKERSVRAALLLGILTFFPDLAAVILGHSATILAGFLEATSETFATFFAWLSLRKVATGKTDVYQYGYGKLESLSSLAVAGVIVLSFAVVLYRAVERLLHPAPVGQVWLGLLISTTVFFLNVYFWRHDRDLARKGLSPIMESQWRLHRVKATANLCTVSSLGLSIVLRPYSWSFYIDPAVSIILAGFLLFSAYRVASCSVYDLLDQTLEEALQFIILQELATYFDEYERFHGVRSRRSGGDVFVEILLEFDGNRKMAEVQRVINEMKVRLEHKIQNSHVSIVPTMSPVV